jgi:OOP family OmpA-OmpF porin
MPRHISPVLLQKYNMKNIAVAALFTTIPFAGLAQLGGLMNKVKNKVNQRVDRKVDQIIDKELDKAEGKTASASSSNTKGTTAAPAEEPVLKSTGKFDFIAGDNIFGLKLVGKQ